MNKKLLRQWKKVFESDLGYIAYELKEIASKPALIFLNGEMGAGKTTFVKTFTQDNSVTSPTYSILHETNSIVYGDFYRLEKNEDIIPLELSAYIEGKAYFLVEWGEKFSRQIIKELPEGFTVYSLDILINNTIENSSIPSRDFYFYSLNVD